MFRSFIGRLLSSMPSDAPDASALALVGALSQLAVDFFSPSSSTIGGSSDAFAGLSGGGGGTGGSSGTSSTSSEVR